MRQIRNIGRIEVDCTNIPALVQATMVKRYFEHKLCFIKVILNLVIGDQVERLYEKKKNPCL